jgi:hypothetical protein
MSDVFSKLHQRLEETLSRLKATEDPVLRRHLLADMRLLLKVAETLVSIGLSQQSLPPGPRMSAESVCVSNYPSFRNIS